MGARAGRKGGKSYNIRTCGVSSWRKYLDKMRRKTTKAQAIEEQDVIETCCDHGEPNCKCCSSPQGCQCG